MSTTVALRTISSLAPGSSTGQPLFDKLPKMMRIFFSVKLTGSYVTAGDTLDLTALFGTSGPPGYQFPSNCLPEKVELQSIQSPGPTSDYIYSYALGTTAANGKLQVFTGAAAQSALTELSAGAYAAALTGDTIEGECIVPVM